MRFSDISGHTRQVETLRRAVASGCAAHAYLFSGPEGVGKRTVALALASALNCTERADGDGEPCGSCADCVSVAEGRHQSVTIVVPEKGIIKIDRMREVAERLRYRVGRGRKVVIVDGAEAMNKEAANAFLKTLEEPPPDTVIVLVTSMAASLLPTILSRCQRMNFHPLTEAEVAGLVERLAGPEAGDARVAARLSAGSVTRALASMDAERSEARREVIGIISGLEAGDTASILDAAYGLSRREDLIEVLEFVKTWYRDKAVVASSSPDLVANTDMMDGLIGQAAPGPRGGAGIDALVAAYEEVERTRESITPPRYANKLLAMETMLMRLADMAAGHACAGR